MRMCMCVHFIWFLFEQAEHDTNGIEYTIAKPSIAYRETHGNTTGGAVLRGIGRKGKETKRYGNAVKLQIFANF